MLTEREVSASIGGTAYSSTGDKIGTVEHFFVDDRTGAPSWVAVTTGLFGTRHSIVPATEASFADGALRVPVSVDEVKSAPHLQGDHLAPDDEARLRRHYGLDSVVGGTPAWTPTAEGLVPPGAGDDVDDRTGADTVVMTGTDAPLPLPPPAAYGAQPPAPTPAPARGSGRLRTWLRARTAAWCATRSSCGSGPSGSPPPGCGWSSTW